MPTVSQNAQRPVSLGVPPTAGSGQVFEVAENVADRDLGPVDVTEHKRDPSGPAVYIDHDTRVRDLTLVVDERSEVTSD